jgi:hypothetical protein
MVEVSIRDGPDIVGSLAVDEPAVAEAQQRHELLHAIANSLAVVVQANRTSAAVERQLREALAHADDIAVSRRSLVADMERDGAASNATCTTVCRGILSRSRR